MSIIRLIELFWTEPVMWGFKSILFLWKPFLKTYALKSEINIESNQHYRTVRKMLSKIMRKKSQIFAFTTCHSGVCLPEFLPWSLSLQNLSVWKLKFVNPWVCHSRVCLSEVFLFSFSFRILSFWSLLTLLWQIVRLTD